jgi:hypothetical protein
MPALHSCARARVYLHPCLNSRTLQQGCLLASAVPSMLRTARSGLTVGSDMWFSNGSGAALLQTHRRHTVGMFASAAFLHFSLGPFLFYWFLVSRFTDD